MNIFESDIYKSLCYGKGMQHENEVDWLWGKLKEMRPRTVLEIGTGGAGTTIILALAGARVVTVDEIVHEPKEYNWNDAAFRAVCPQPHVILVEGDSHDDATLEAVQRHDPFFDWVVIDGDHSLLGGWQDWVMYAPLARQAVLVHDIAYYGTMMEDWFPRSAWDVLKARYRTEELVDVPSGGWGLVRADGIQAMSDYEKFLEVRYAAEEVLGG